MKNLKELLQFTNSDKSKEMKSYLSIVLSVLILFSISPSHQEERRESSRREGQDAQQTQDEVYDRPSDILLDKLRSVKGGSFSDLAKELGVHLQSLPSHKKTVQIGASRSVVNTQSARTYCQTRQSCVDLPQPRDIYGNINGIHWPFCAMAQQCSGCCDLMSSLLECKPTRVSNHSVDVMFIPYGFLSGRSAVASRSSSSLRSSLVPRMVTTTVTVHEKCGCKCRTRASSCDQQRQVFREEHCRCECKPETRVRCQARYKWSEAECRCICAHPAAICPQGKVWSKESCGCVCALKFCEGNQKLNKDKCICEDDAAVVHKKFKNFPGFGFGK